MILVFILLGIIAFVLLLAFIILSSTLKIEIKDLNLSNMKGKKANYVIKISLNVFKNVKWLWVSLNSKKVEKIISKIPEIDIKKIESDFKLEDIKVLGKLHTKISKFKLNADIGLENPILTAFLVTFLCSSISIAIPLINAKSYMKNASPSKRLNKFYNSKKLNKLRNSRKLNEKNYEYSIKPIYNNQNLYKIELNCIIELKIVHIINVIYILIKKGKSDKNERTASNRKPYAYSNE